MTVFRKLRLNAVFLGISALLMGSGAAAFDPITIVDQQSFAAGGKVETAPGTFEANRPTEAGQSIHGDHAYFFCQKPADAKPLAMTFLHGAMQFSKTWETTPDGREGFQTIFLRKGWQTCVVDQPRRGNAGRALADAEIKAAKNDQTLFGMFRLGLWPKFYDGVAFKQDAAVLDQFFRQVTPNIGPFDAEIAAAGVAAGLEKTAQWLPMNLAEVSFFQKEKLPKRCRASSGRFRPMKSRLKHSKSSPAFRSSSITATTSRAAPLLFPMRTSGACALIWHDFG